MISVIMVQHNSYQLSLQALASLRRHHTVPYEIILVDNGSTEAGAIRLEDDLEGVTVLRSDRNMGFGAANNAGAKLARGDLLLFLNNDTITEHSFIARLEGYFRQHPACGAAGMALMNRDGSSQYSVGQFPTVLREWKMKRRQLLYASSESRAVDWVTGAALSVRRDVFEQIGGFDERYFMYFEDVDLCKRIRDAGYEVHYVALFCIIHLGGGSQPHGASVNMEFEYRRSQVLYYSLHASVMQNVLLRVYLCSKYARFIITGAKERQQVARKVINILFGP